MLEWQTKVQLARSCVSSFILPPPIRTLSIHWLVDMDQDENFAPIGVKDTGTSRQFDVIFDWNFINNSDQLAWI